MSDSAPDTATPPHQPKNLEYDVPSNFPTTLDPDDGAQAQGLVNDIQAALRDLGV
ncbi:hypothetical protein AB1046_22510 [Promicromonospora sp. Populi]|uniref:hypothetical protein n=1 Tax=Promicromonospora sp. Populi TaxID=3239420 RepID=UPI0034E247B1